MKAENTVMSDEQLTRETFYTDIPASVRFAVQAQAEISFKAGIREVTKWLNSHSSLQQGVDEKGRLSWLVRDEWQAKLKEWEVDLG